ncbi:PIR Superfamily Protein [Plasmodium ovale curtisi]|uniref:PIR Superfamily Protein n=1 Tax=Plasmodium ovale curtisi TaxID=864141 RepID=A0A1A8X647_PLAOA|nr:PIR Superfamily Protein [Plasmodium ovale curtisi]
MADDDINEILLPSNSSKNELLEKTGIENLEIMCNSEKQDHFGMDELLIKFNSKLITNYNRVVNRYGINVNKTKYCRDVNYYFDRVIGFIESSKLTARSKEALTFILNEFFTQNDRRFKKHECQRQKDEYSTQKRCILKQLYDSYEDRNHLPKIFAQNIPQDIQYKKYYEDKWGKILQSNQINEILYFSIKCNSKKKFKYSDFLMKPQEICSNNYNSIRLEDIIVTKERLSSEEDTYLTLPSEERSAQDIDFPRPLSPGMEIEPTISSITWTEILFPLIIAPVVFPPFFFIIYKFSPVGRWLRNQIRGKSIKINDTVEHKTHDFFENYKNNKYHMLYHNASHQFDD